jgi:hypothetical protein
MAKADAFRKMSPERCQRIKDTLEAALRDGFDPKGQSSGGKGSAVSEAARRLVERGYKETRQSVHGFLKTQERAKVRGEDHFCPDWGLFSRPGVEPARLRRGELRRWILTAAQDDTDIHLRFWGNLRAFAGYLGAEIVVGGFTYNHALYTDHETRNAQFREDLLPFMRFEQMELGPVLFCAEMNTLPTAVRPLSGLQSYSRGRDAVFPHAKLAYQTVPQMPGAYVPSIMTTGACTVPNYVRKKAGLKAEFHHILGATIVEVDGEGRSWCRQISAASDGSFQDLDIQVRDGRISAGHRVKAVTFGDVHLPSVEEDVFAALWGAHADSLVDALRPEYAFFHDLLSFEASSRHVEGDPLHRARMVAQGQSGIEAQVGLAARFLRQTEREFCRSVVVESNHDDRLMQWTRRQVDRNDIENVAYWHRCNLAVLESERSGEAGFNLLRWALRRADPRRLDGIEFVPIGGSFQICQDSGGIECGMHGHLGPNGSRGTAVGLTRMATRITIGDKHSPEISDGVYVAGITGALDQGYNKGPSSWRRAHVVTYPNGKRAIVTQAEGGAWRA